MGRTSIERIDRRFGGLFLYRPFLWFGNVRSGQSGKLPCKLDSGLAILNVTPGDSLLLW